MMLLNNINLVGPSRKVIQNRIKYLREQHSNADFYLVGATQMK